MGFVYNALHSLFDTLISLNDNGSNPNFRRGINFAIPVFKSIINKIGICNLMQVWLWYIITYVSTSKAQIDVKAAKKQNITTLAQNALKKEILKKQASLSVSNLMFG